MSLTEGGIAFFRLGYPSSPPLLPSVPELRDLPGHRVTLGRQALQGLVA